MLVSELLFWLFYQGKNQSPTNLGSNIRHQHWCDFLFRYEEPEIAQKYVMHFYHVIILYFLDMLHMSRINIDDFQI